MSFKYCTRRSAHTEVSVDNLIILFGRPMLSWSRSWGLVSWSWS